MRPRIDACQLLSKLNESPGRKKRVGTPRVRVSCRCCPSMSPSMPNTHRLPTGPPPIAELMLPVSNPMDSMPTASMWASLLLVHLPPTLKPTYQPVHENTGGGGGGGAL